MPSNVFGVNDNFDPDNSHVLGALLRKIYDAKLSGKKKLKFGEPANLEGNFFTLMI